MNKPINVKYVDFWNGFQPNNDFVFGSIIGESFELKESTNPNILFFSLFGSEHAKYNCVKVFYTGENRKTNSNYDFSFSFNDNSNTNFQLPNFARFKSFFDFQKTHKPIYNIDKTEFCNFLYFNNNALQRINFAEHY